MVIQITEVSRVVLRKVVFLMFMLQCSAVYELSDLG